ncbi:MAG: protocatechuate 3,4-dioxygenase subunit alpha [Brevibacterium aurantiacum]|uniref:Protocatechuate 3,4-dioxygenase alpha chain n=1 Tax=Brevibacterium aurantiacum TaxID=273384 RepID=A0A1D7W094_BREAU|nr:MULTISPECIES: protocatechuate 3,4-dioxygenase subunit alpha [Brevibacterium]MDN5550270.1 protocatechuate 3,4-dioxygenase subunit alpha [Brevibacterium sp.]AOP52489.1 Protocatechuate 3,4-dioxygenase alpha chain [Brevibacterium aurantiacum]AZL04825.1 protocatechuate 3,4-dioxygenase subunit alpha [Brevibacterium aurantiacum]AZL12020.1 protocatechuate 3,4-dioxygenase subunit alpha [Brevibacterium aurantiacum]AZT92388.1 protocatechuate 3,4-dioxygenase subunit alpha [Brevibacterium aurantiacum]
MTDQKLTATPGQTVGPFYGYAMPWPGDNELVPPAKDGAVQLHGYVYDGAGAPVPDAILEIWQPDGNGDVSRNSGSLRRDGFTFTGFGRNAVDPEGRFVFSTLNPGPTEAGKAPFISVVVFARGLLNRLFTRIYLPEDTAALTADPLLSSLDEADRNRLIATREADGSLRFDIRLQGEDETPFLRFPSHED